MSKPERELPRAGASRSGSQFIPDRASAAPLSDATLRAQSAVAGGEVTFTYTPIGSGRRVGIDADLDGYLDGDGRDAGSDPRNAASHP